MEVMAKTAGGEGGKRNEVQRCRTMEKTKSLPAKIQSAN